MKQVLIFTLLILSISTMTVSLHNLQAFFNNTYDMNQDGHATIDEFVKYFQWLEPDHNLTVDDIKESFEMFDSNSDKKVTLKQLVQIARVNVDVVRMGHKQIHLGLTSKQGEMQVMWVTAITNCTHPVVHYGRFPSQLNQKAYAVISTYNVGHIGFMGSIYKAVLTNLEPGKRYYYKVGDQKQKVYSAIKHFNGPPRKNQILDQINIAVFGDMGTFAPLGHMVINQIVRDNLAKPVDFVFLTGDIAYAGMNSEQNGETQPIWDLFGELTESFAAYCPFMPGVGNHEKYYNYTAYRSRYDLPKIYPSQTNFWFSFDFGQVHIIHFSSEHPYTPGSQQYMFLQNDMKQARANPNTKWIILGVHRAFYSSDKDGYAPMRPLTVLQDLVNKYKIDIVQTGHEHCYERTWPTFKGKAMKQGHTQNHFKNPSVPIYVVQGSAGALIREVYVNPKPEWSIKRMNKYGYGRIQIKGNTLKYQFISAFSSRVIDQWYITKE